MLIVVAAIWFYELTVVNGRFEDLRRSFSAVGRGDLRVQAMLIAFCFGGLLEALAGFGAPVAITAVMLMALGLPPVKAAVTVLLANTAPVAFGAMAIPVTTAGNLTGIPAEDIAAVIGRQSPLLALFVPLLLLFVVDGTRGIRQLWPIALVTGAVFAVGPVLVLQPLRVRAHRCGRLARRLRRRRADAALLEAVHPRGPALAGRERTADAPPRFTYAVLPYVLVIAVFALAKMRMSEPSTYRKLLGHLNISVEWPGLYGKLLTPGSDPCVQRDLQAGGPGRPGHAPDHLRHPGDADLPVRQGRRRLPADRVDGRVRAGRTLRNMRGAIMTVATVLALSYVMNQSGQTVAIGTWLATAPAALFALLSPILGWLGTAVTGSDTSANALFANLQQTAGQAGRARPERCWSPRTPPAVSSASW